MATPAYNNPTGPPPAVSTPQAPKLVLTLKKWMTVSIIVTFILSFFVLGLSAWLIHGAYIDAMGLAIAVSVLTWACVLYILLTTASKSLAPFYHVYAVLAVSSFMTLMWLVTMAVAAHDRASYKYNVTIGNCYNDGSLVDSTTCSIFRRILLPRQAGVVLTKTGQAVETTVAVVSAIQFLLWLPFTIILWTLWNEARKTQQYTLPQAHQPGAPPLPLTEKPAHHGIVVPGNNSGVPDAHPYSTELPTPTPL